MAPVTRHRNDPLVTTSRRALLGGAAATLVGAAFPGMARAQRATPEPGPRSAQEGSWLVVVPDAHDTGYITGGTLAIFAPNGAEIARLALPSIDGSVVITGDPRKVLVPTPVGPHLVTLDPPGAVPITGTALPPDASPWDTMGDFGAAHRDWALLRHSSGEIGAPKRDVQVVLARLDRANGVDIWPWIGGDARYPPSIQRFSASGMWLTTWDEAELAWSTITDTPTIIDIPAWLVPTADPAAARVVGAADGRRSTAAIVSPSDRFVAWTAFDPDTLLGAIMVEPVGGGGAVELAPANMWSRAIWLPGEADRIVTFGHGEIALHEIDAAGVPASTILARGELIASRRCAISADGRRALAGSRSEPDGPQAWQWIDLDRGEAAALAALDGLRRESSSGVNAWPRWLLFGPDSLRGYEPLVGLDMETGDTTQLVELMQGPDGVSTSADGRIAVLATDWEDTTPARLVDVATGAVTSLWAARTQMVRSGVVSPDGSRAAIHAVGNADHALEVLMIDTADPAAMQSLSPGAAALWTAELS